MTAIIAKNSPPEGSAFSAAYFARKFSSAPKVSMNTSAIADAGTADFENSALTFSGCGVASTGLSLSSRNRMTAMTIEPAAQRKRTV